jgi:hypothetical protein
LEVTGGKGEFSSTPTAGAGSVAGLTAADTSAPWKTGSDGAVGAYQTRAQNFQRSIYRAYQAPADGPSSILPSLPRGQQTLISPYTGKNPVGLINDQFSSHSPILPLPKIPGSVFQ